jgi:hypothetical protein
MFNVKVFKSNVLFCIIIGNVPIISSRPSKLMPKHLLNYIIYMKHDNVTMYVTFMWNWSKFALYDDVIFIASCINHALENEIQ